MILLDGSHLTLTDLLAIADNRAAVGVAPEARTRVAASRAVVDRKAEGTEAVYGVNTGFGSFAETRIDKRDLAALQLNLLRSHAAGVGAPLPVRVVRAAMALRANVLAKGFSGIRLETLELILECLNRGVHPVIPEKGSLGASGDLAPLAFDLALSDQAADATAERLVDGGRRAPGPGHAFKHVDDNGLGPHLR